MDSIILEIEKVKKELLEYTIIEKGNVFNDHKDARSSIKTKWLGLCMFEEEIGYIVNKLRTLPNIASTNIASPMHPEFIQVLNTMMAVASPQVFTRDSVKLLEEYMDAYESMKTNPDILNAIQSFRMNKVRLNLIANIASLQEHLIQYRKDIENWTKRSKSTSTTSMHS